MTDKPKTPDHFRQFESDRPGDHERAMTPFEPFDSRPKIASARAVDPLAGVARLFPRDPRTPLNVSEIERLRLERAGRDTEPSELFGDEDKTPAARPFEIRVERELKDLRSDVSALQADVSAIKQSSRETAQHTVDMYELVKAINRRQLAFELERRWVPAVAYLVTTAIALLALIRTYR